MRKRSLTLPLALLLAALPLHGTLLASPQEIHAVVRGVAAVGMTVSDADCLAEFFTGVLGF